MRAMRSGNGTGRDARSNEFFVLGSRDETSGCQLCVASIADDGSLTVVKMVDFSYKLPSSIPEDAVYAAPPPQQFKAAPPGSLTREHRADPRSNHPAGLRPRGSLNRIRAASRSPQPVLRCKRRSQLSRYRAPVRPHVLHSRPCRYGEGDMHAPAEGCHPPAGAVLAVRSRRGWQSVSCRCGLRPVHLATRHVQRELVRGMQTRDHGDGAGAVQAGALDLPLPVHLAGGPSRAMLLGLTKPDATTSSTTVCSSRLVRWIFPVTPTVKR